MSPVPASPVSPERCSSAEASSDGGMPMCSSSQRMSPGSTEPERVAITRPSSGVKPIVVSTERPPRTAASDAPAPRWHVTMRNSSCTRPASSAARRDAYACERPWKPKRRNVQRRRHSRGSA